MTQPPLVSIAIPAYNHAVFIEDCLESVCAQTYPELELVLIDDGSTDDTFAIAQDFLASRRERFRRIVLERRTNSGVSANSNACIEACQGQWVHLLGSDDILYPSKVERIHQAIAQWNCPQLALVHADCDYIGQDGGAVSRAKQKTRPAPGPDFSAHRGLFLGNHAVFNPTVALHRETFLSIGGFDRTLPLEDLDCWLRLSVGHAVARIPETLAAYRKHPGNSLRRRVKMLSALFETYAKFITANPDALTDQDIRSHFRRNVWRFWRRVRKQHPTMLAVVLLSIARSHFIKPTAQDYRNYAKKLGALSHA